MRGWAVLLALGMAGGAAAAKPVESWGKPGVGFDQYRADAVRCATQGYFRDVSQDEPAKAFVRGFRSAEDRMSVPPLDMDRGVPALATEHFTGIWRDSIRQTQPDRRRREVQAIQVNDVEQCLTAKGYAKFVLTRDEAKALARYPAGSEGRRRYLHQLAAMTRTK